MVRFLLRRLLILPFALLVINFIAFSYAHVAQRVQQTQNPFGSAVDTSVPLLSLYRTYISHLTRGDWGTLPQIGSAAQTVQEVVLPAATASLLLVAIAFTLSVVIGLLLGLAAVRAIPPALKGWLPPLASVGLAAPSFFIGALGITLVLAWSLRSGDGRLLLPLNGYGLDAHLLLPVLALSLRPAMQIAQTTASVLVDELGKQHVITARSLGIPLRTIRTKHALRNALPTIILSVAASLRLLIGELILVEWLFGWPGLGRLLSTALLPPTIASIGGVTSGAARIFLHPELLAAILTLFGLIFLLIDFVSSLAAFAIDPRLRGSLERSHE